MFRKLFLVFVLLFVSSMACASTDDAVEQLTQLLNGYNSYQAEFTQLTYFGDRGAPQKSAGRVMMLRPGKFRWEIDKPTKQIIIANGNTLWVYDVELQQVTQQQFSKQQGMNPAALLTGDVSALSQQFVITKIHWKGAIWFQLKPKSADSSFTLIQMQFRHDQLVNMQVKNKN